MAVRYGNVVKCERLRLVWDHLTILEADVRNRGALEAVRRAAPSVVFHLAAHNQVWQSFEQVEECFDANGNGTANLLDIYSEVD